MRKIVKYLPFLSTLSHLKKHRPLVIHNYDCDFEN